MATSPILSPLMNRFLFTEKDEFLKCNICKEVYFHVNNPVGMAEHMRGEKHLKVLKTHESSPSSENSSTGLLSPTSSSVASNRKNPNFFDDIKSDKAALPTISRCGLCGTHVGLSSSALQNPPSTSGSESSTRNESTYCESCEGAITQSVLSEFQQTHMQEVHPNKQITAKPQKELLPAGEGGTCDGCGAICLYNKTFKKHKQKCPKYKALARGKDTPSDASSKSSAMSKKKKQRKAKTIKCVEQNCHRMFKASHHMQTHFDITHRSTKALGPKASPAISLPSPPKPVTPAATTQSVPDKRVDCSRLTCQKKFASASSMHAHYTSGACDPNKPKKWKSLLKRMPVEDTSPVKYTSPTLAVILKRQSAINAVGQVECKRSNCQQKFKDEHTMQVHFDSGACIPKPQIALAAPYSSPKAPQTTIKKKSKTKAKAVKCENSACKKMFRKKQYMQEHLNSGSCRNLNATTGMTNKATKKQIRKQTLESTLICTGAPACTRMFKCQASVQQHIQSGICKARKDTTPVTSVKIHKDIAEVPKKKIEVSAPTVCQPPLESPTEQDLEIIPVEVERELLVLIPTPPPEEPVQRKAIRSRSPVKNPSRREKWVIVGRDEVESDDEFEEGVATPDSDSEDDFVHVERILD